MTRLAISIGVLLVLGSCSGPTLLSGEGVACSVNSNADPYRKCDRAEADYVCINTYKVQQTPVWVCRVACSDIRDCKNSGDVCCQAPIYGNNLGKVAACVPATDCDPPSIIVPPPILPMSMMPDGGGVDARVSRSDAAAATPDAASSTLDAASSNLDAATEDASEDAGGGDGAAI